MKIIGVGLIAFLFFPLAVFSQTVSKADSLKLQFQKDSAHIYRFKKLRPYAALDKRNSWIKNEKGSRRIPVSINGAQAGIILLEKHIIGLGYYSITKQSLRPVKLTDANNKSTYEELFMQYCTFFYEYTIFKFRYFEMNLPLEAGLGRYIYNLKDETQSFLLWREAGPLRMTSGGVSIILKPLKWIGVTGLAGYRFAAFNKKTNLNFNGLFYSYGVWLDLRQVYRDIKFYGFVRRKYRNNLNAISTSGG